MMSQIINYRFFADFVDSETYLVLIIAEKTLFSEVLPRKNTVFLVFPVFSSVVSFCVE